MFWYGQQSHGVCGSNERVKLYIKTNRSSGLRGMVKKPGYAVHVLHFVTAFENWPMAATGRNAVVLAAWHKLRQRTMPNNNKATKRKVAAAAADQHAHAKRAPSVASDVPQSKENALPQQQSQQLGSVAVAPAGSQCNLTMPQKQMFSLVSGKLNSARSSVQPPTLVEVGHSMASLSDASGDNHQCRTWLELCQLNGCMDNKAIMKNDLIDYLRFELFPKLKFSLGKHNCCIGPNQGAFVA
jgi:hypothetical protein